MTQIIKQEEELELPLTKQYLNKIIYTGNIFLFKKILNSYSYEVNASEVIDIIEDENIILFNCLLNNNYDFSTNNCCVIFYCIQEKKLDYLEKILQNNHSLIEVIKREKQRYNIEEDIIILLEKIILADTIKEKESDNLSLSKIYKL